MYCRRHSKGTGPEREREIMNIGHRIPKTFEALFAEVVSLGGEIEDNGGSNDRSGSFRVYLPKAYQGGETRMTVVTDCGYYTHNGRYQVGGAQRIREGISRRRSWLVKAQSA